MNHIDSRIELENESEGWFPGIEDSAVRGCVEAEFATASGDHLWLLVRLDAALDLQLPAPESAARQRLVRCERVWIRPRHVDSVLSARVARSVFVCMVRDGAVPEEHVRSVVAPDFWAACRLVD